MRKNRLLSLIALILVAIMLFTSCNSPTIDGAVSDGDDYVIDRTQIAKTWAEYLVYNAPEKAPVVNATEILADLELDAKPTIKDKLIVVTDTVETEVESAEGNYTKVIATEKWFSKESGALVQTFVSDYNIYSGSTIPQGVDVTSKVRYSISFDPFNNGNDDFIRVSRFTFVLKTAEADEAPLDPTLIDSYDTKTDISYYYADGTPFLTGLTEMLSVRNVENSSARKAGYYLIDCEEKSKTYLVNGEGAIAREFDYMKEYNVPVYDEGSLNVNGTGYAYFEVGDYKYVITEEAHQAMPIGDLYLVLLPGINITITDANDKAIANYTSDCYAITGYAVLDNGNVYLCEYELLNKDATEYDILSGEEKLNVTHKLINVKDGTISKLNLDFTPFKLFNNNTRKINSFWNLITLGIEDPNNRTSLLDTVTVKDGFILAEIQKYAEGKLDTKSVYVVLNENLEVVKELPAIIENQFSYPAFINEYELIVSTRTTNNKVIYYSVNTTNGETTLAPTLTAQKRIQKLNNGYFYNEKVYDTEWKLLHDFSDNTNTSSFRVINGELYYYDVDANSTKIIKKGSISLGDYDYVEEKPAYSFYTNDFLMDGSFYSNNMFKYTEEYEGSYYNSYYNLEGTRMISDDRGVDYIHSELLGVDVMYRLNISVELYNYEGYTLAIKTYRYTQEEYLGEDTGLDAYFSEYELFIIK